MIQNGHSGMGSGSRRIVGGLALALAAAAIVVSASAAPRPAAAPWSAMRWRSVGPTIGGRVVAVAGVSGVGGHPDVFYMGAVDGGVWRSDDAGVTWKNLTDGSLPGSSNSIGAIAVAPSDAHTIYVGTGESDIRGDVITGDGVFRSDDAGKTWRPCGLADTHTISALVVDPHDANVVYAASMGHVFASNPARGVFKSTDGGKTWSNSLYVDAKTGAIDLVMDPTHPSTLYAAMWQAVRKPWTLQDGGPGSGLYKTTDGGAHWADIARNPGFPTGVLGRIGVSIAASDPRIVYAIVQAKSGGVFRSNDAGATWVRVNSNWSLRQRAFYYMSVFVDPVDADTVYVPEVDALWVSHDGGKHFAKLHTPHGDNHIVWIDPRRPRILLEGNDGGATVSTNGGRTWSGEHNQPTGQFYHVALDDRFPFHIYGAQQDEGSFEGPSATPSGLIPLGDWHRAAYGEATFVAPQPGDPRITYGSGYFSILLRHDARTGEYREVSPWPEYQEGAASRELKYRFGWTHPILFSPANPKALLIASQRVLESLDGGETWKVISPDLTRNDPATERPSGGPVDLDQSGAEIFPDVSALAPSALDANVIWAGSADGLVHVTTDGGAHWRLVTPPALPQWAEITSIEPSPVAKGTAWLTASRYQWDDFHPYVFETTDYGAHWTLRTRGLPANDYVFVVRADPNEPRLMFVGTKNAVFASFDGGEQWRPLSMNLPKVQVRDLAIDPRQQALVAATHGRSFWVLDDLSLLEQLTRTPASAATSTEAVVYAPATAWLTHAYGRSPYAKYVHDAGENPVFGATIDYALPPTYDGKTPVELRILDANGRTVRRFRLHWKAHATPLPATVRDNWTPSQAKRAAEARLTAAEPGMNRLRWDLRYPDATEVKGFQAPIAAGGLDDTVAGPTVVPGRYTVVLDYGGHESSATFEVQLDPRLQPTPGALQARFELASRIHSTLDSLDRTFNEAIAIRDRLAALTTGGHAHAPGAREALTALAKDIHALVALQIQSSEGSLLHETKLRSHLAYLAADVDLSYERPTAAEFAVFEHLQSQARSGERQLRTDIVRGRRFL